MHGDGSRDAIGLRINYRDCAGLRVDDVDLVTNGIGGQIGGIGPDLKSMILPQIDEVEHRDGVGSAVADVGELAVAVWNVGKAAPPAARGAQNERTDGR